MAGFSLNERNSIERRLRALEAQVSRFGSKVGPGANIVYNVTLSGSLTGTAFTLSYADLIQASVLLVLRGRVLKPGYDFTVVGATLTMLRGAPFRAGEADADFNHFFVHSAKRGI